MPLDFDVIQATLLLGSHRHCKFARLVYELWLAWRNDGLLPSVWAPSHLVWGVLFTSLNPDKMSSVLGSACCLFAEYNTGVSICTVKDNLGIS